MHNSLRTECRHERHVHAYSRTKNQLRDSYTFGGWKILLMLKADISVSLEAGGIFC